MAKTRAKAGEQARNYVNGWAAMTQMMDSGQSWSGHERKCGYLNLRDGTFVDVSALAGLDFLGDGRSLAVTDWNGDGRLDAWLKNRTGPQLRYLHNNSDGPAHWIAFLLKGKTCNRDAIGAKVVVEAGGRRLVRTLLAGDGYLAQSSKWIHFGLDDAQRVERMEVVWPDGRRQAFAELAADLRYKIEQDGGPVAVEPARVASLNCTPADEPQGEGSVRLVLKVPLPMPPSVQRVIADGSAGRSITLLNLWAEWCAPCKQELTSFAREQGALEGAGVKVVAVNLDEPANRARAESWFRKTFSEGEGPRMCRLHLADAPLIDTLDAIFRHVRHKLGKWPMPTSFLLDERGAVQIIYLGPVSVEQLAADARTYGKNAVAAHERKQFPGRWYYRTFRDLPGLTEDLTQRGRTEDADFYRQLSGQNLGRS